MLRPLPATPGYVLGKKYVNKDYYAGQQPGVLHPQAEKKINSRPNAEARPLEL
jgi:hypothetical protein